MTLYSCMAKKCGKNVINYYILNKNIGNTSTGRNCLHTSSSSSLLLLFYSTGTTGIGAGTGAGIKNVSKNSSKSIRNTNLDGLSSVSNSIIRIHNNDNPKIQNSIFNFIAASIIIISSSSSSSLSCQGENESNESNERNDSKKHVFYDHNEISQGNNNSKAQVIEEYDEKEERNCPFCNFFLDSPCKDSFIDWQKCVKKSENPTDCMEPFHPLKRCMDENGILLEGVDDDDDSNEEGESEKY